MKTKTLFVLSAAIVLSLSVFTACDKTKTNSDENESEVIQVNTDISECKVTEIEKYGNLILDKTADEALKTGFNYGDIVNVFINGKSYEMPIGTNYSDVDDGKPVLLLHNGKIIVAINNGDFVSENGIAEKTVNENGDVTWSVSPDSLSVGIKMKDGGEGGYYDEWYTRQLSLIVNREDAENLTDEQYANFRPIETTGFGKNIIYRSSSPIVTDYGRNGYVNTAMKNAGIKTCLNLVDSYNEMIACDGWNESYYSTCNILPLSMGLDYSEADFAEKVVEGIRFMLANEGPYLIHCRHGYSRTGMFCAILESLMGATVDEVIDDYMLSYEYLYGLEKGSEKYEKILEISLNSNHPEMFGDNIKECEDLSKLAEDYLKSAGLTDEEITALEELLAE